MKTIIVCQDCAEVIDYMDGEKVEVLYGKCRDCHGSADVEWLDGVAVNEEIRLGTIGA
ncbi:hypothetical protein GCM10025857_29760 [Alicyclobacillus contaminans]|uniref:GapA-binding peptide SR1P n=1 Tax=Alicyclobacillus contaminans TaxID=392016 RepID=UPI0004126C6F|nr:hypothetical protein GCM10025857_29760 [Alicyclobacillus contaminans]